MNTRFCSSITLKLSLVFALALSGFTFISAPTKAQANNTNLQIVGRLSKYSPLEAPLLTRSSRGQPVRDVQAVLKWLGFYNGAIDGIYGPRTSRAVVAFQRSQRLVGDGRVGTLTWQALRDSIPPVDRNPF
ncbi:peptidoglycan-binding protein [Anabaena sp. 4-3]|uniref:peptidoglycan-binding domain-containing protein n=1 Tax=Anabaena sp. 4-3 TaxID=1811979 RepID=UPI0008339A8B|nr:peptidoglycan-binding domain-containing protein [Anabaena sp. 4-3]